MSFVDFSFYPAILCAIVVTSLIQVLCKNMRRSNMMTKAVLLLFSYLVIYLFDWRFCLCILVVTIITFCSAIWIENAGETKMRGRLAAIAVIILILFLGVFKYLNFFMTSVMALFGRPWTAVRIILPIGISFYIFSAIGYVMDVYWENIPAERNPLDMALFLAFFPKLICGPIVNGRDFLPQLKENRRITLKNIELGAQIFTFGLFKKIVLADRLAAFVDNVYGSPAAFGTLTVWLAVFSDFIQLYFDFSGYSDMAVGISKVFGYDIKRNFNLPFIARNISEFWDRWHISLSSWLNEYVFNPVAIKLKRRMAKLPKEKRTRYKNLPTYSALLITFLVSGIWHGAGYTFILYGLCHGIYSIIHSMYVNWMKKHHRGFAEEKGKRIVALDILGNFIIVNIIQVLFSAGTLEKAASIYGQMFSVHTGITHPYVWSFISFALLAVGTFAAWRRRPRTGSTEIEGYYPIYDLSTVKGLTIFFLEMGVIAGLAYIGGGGYFVYAQF